MFKDTSGRQNSQACSSASSNLMQQHLRLQSDAMPGPSVIYIAGTIQQQQHEAQPMEVDGDDSQQVKWQQQQKQQSHIKPSQSNFSNVQQRPPQQQVSTHAESMYHWQHCLDYCNGGPGFYIAELMSAGNSGSSPTPCNATSANTRARQQRGVRALAYFDDHAGVPAAVQCCIGSGVAVLCATHPELAPEWLLPACSCIEQGHAPAAVRTIPNEGPSIGKQLKALTLFVEELWV